MINLEANRTYMFLDERWCSFGDRDVVIEGNGATLVSRVPNGAPITPLGAGPVIWDGSPATAHLGHRISSAPSGATSLFLKDLSPDHYLPGDRILIAGLIQQVDGDTAAGWPPNFRFFEYHTVAAVVPGILTLIEPLRFSYHEEWKDYPQNIFGHSFLFGAPRIWRWRHEDGRRPNRSLTIRDVTFDGGSFGTSMWHLRLERCTVKPRTFWPTVCRSVELVNCVMTGMELDKLCGSFEMIGGEVTGNMVGGGGRGVLDVAFRNVKFSHFFQNVPSETFVIENCIFEDGVHLATLGATNSKEPFTLTAFANERK